MRDARAPDKAASLLGTRNSEDPLRDFAGISDREKIRPQRAAQPDQNRSLFG
jgi:hypothetical protein